MTTTTFTYKKHSVRVLRADTTNGFSIYIDEKLADQGRSYETINELCQIARDLIDNDDLDVAWADQAKKS